MGSFIYLPEGSTHAECCCGRVSTMGRARYQGLSAMGEFIAERIEVEKAETSPRPVSFCWRGGHHDVVEVLREWVDIGFGALPPRSRKWYNRRHRRYYVVRDAEGCVFEIYLDYANRRKRTWWLVQRLE